MIDMRTVRKQAIVSILAANLLVLSLPANAVQADNPTREPVQAITSKSAGAPSKKSASPKAPAQGPTSKPEGTGNFVYGLINTIRNQSKDLCARYGNPADCLQEAEVCLTMRDNDDNQVRLCLNTAPGDSGDPGSVQKSRLRR